MRADLVEAAREAAEASFDALAACAFNYEAHATDFTNLSRLPVLKARMNADLHACWFVDTECSEESFFVRHAYFLGANDPYSVLETTLRAEVDEEA